MLSALCFSSHRCPRNKLKVRRDYWFTLRERNKAAPDMPDNITWYTAGLDFKVIYRNFTLYFSAPRALWLAPSSDLFAVLFESGQEVKRIVISLFLFPVNANLAVLLRKTRRHKISCEYVSLFIDRRIDAFIPLSNFHVMIACRLIRSHATRRPESIVWFCRLDRFFTL